MSFGGIDQSSGSSSTTNRMGYADLFASPFADQASLYMPESNRSALQLCEFIFNSFGSYRSATERVIAYFLTEMEIGGELGDDEKRKWEKYFNDDLDILTFTRSVLLDRMCYGNSFSSIFAPFRRFLICPRCGIQVALREMYYNTLFNFKFQNFEFTATCPKCEYSGAWKVNDQPENDAKRLKLIRWNVHEIEIIHDLFTDETQYVWRIPQDYKRMVSEGHLFHLERVNMEILKAIKNGWYFLFHPDQIFHMKEPTVGGLRTRGWGISRTLINFRQIYYVQTLRRQNEAIALDYVIPFRVVTPEPRPGAADSATGDPLMMQDMSTYMSLIRRMIRSRRRNPAGWYTLPFPVRYTALGGDAKNLVPVDLLKDGQAVLLNDVGYPMEFFQGSLQVQTAIPAMRLFESQWRPMVHDANFYLNWVMRKVSQILSWESGKCSLKRPTHADDMARQGAMLQLMAGQTISQTSALRGLGVNWRDEQRLITEEARYQQEMRARIQEEMDQSGFAEQIAKGMPPVPPGGAPMGPPGAMPPGGMPPGGAPPGAMPAPMGMATGVMPTSTNASVTPQDIMAEAKMKAEELMGLPEPMKDSELRRMKQENEVLHLAVKGEIEKIRQQARMAGGSAILAQTYGGG